MNQNGAQDTIDLKAIFSKIVSKWWLFLITISIALAAGVAHIKTTPKSYMVKAVMRMSEGKRSSFGGNHEEFLKGTSLLRSEAELEDEIALLKSTTNLLKTLHRVNFTISYYERKNFMTQESYDAPPFIVRLDSNVAQFTGLPIHVKVDTVAKTYHVTAEAKNVVMYDLRTEKLSSDFVPKVKIDGTAKLGEPFRAEHLSFTLDAPKGFKYNSKSDYFFFINSIDELLRQWRGVSADPMSDESNIVILGMSGEVVSKQAKFLNTLMATYIESEQEKNNQKGKATIAFIDEALGQSGRQLRQAQADLQAAQAGGQMGEAGTQSNALNQELFRQQDEESKIQSQLLSLNSLVTTMSADNGGTPNTIAASGINAPSLNTLIDKYNQDVAKLRSEELNVRIATAPIIALRRTVQTERDQIIQSAQALIRQTQNELNSTQQRISQLRGQLYALPGQATRTKIVMNSYEITEGLHNYLLEKSYEAQIAVNSDQVDKSVVDNARVEDGGPIAPDKKMTLGGAILVGLLVPLLFILIRDFFNDKIADVDELKRVTNVPLLATIPSSKRKRITPEEPKSLLAESFRTARINLQYLNPDAQRQVVGMTSSTSGEGKTFCAINLATVMALSGKRTLLIDADMRRPRVQEYLELPDGPGLSTVLIGDTELDGAVRKSGVPGLDVITAGPIPPNPLELVESSHMAKLFTLARSRYDQIVVDASPMGLVSEFKVIIGYVDVTLYVVRQGYTRRGMLRAVSELVREGKLKHVDLLLNDVKAGQGYGDGYGYYTK